MPDSQPKTPTLRRRVIQSSAALFTGLAGCSFVESDQQPTSSPSETERSTSTPAPTAQSTEKQTDMTSVSSSEFLTENERNSSEAIRTMIEDVAADGRSRIHWDSETVTVEETIAPETDGTEVTIEGGGGAAIDGTGFDGHILDLKSAPNINIRNIRIMGSHGKRAARSLIPGDGATLNNIILDSGAGGLEIRRSNVRITNIKANGHRDKANGYAAGIHAAGDIDNIQISNIDIRNCDRGVEIDDGPSEWTVERGSIRSIDNSQADDPGVPFALDCHVHAGEAPIENGTFRDIRVADCQRGLTISEHEEGLVSGITAEDIRVERIRGGVHVLCEADIELVNPTVVAGKDNDNWGIFVRGGAVKVNGGEVVTPSGRGLTTREGSRTPLKEVQLDGLTITGGDPNSAS